MACGKITGPGWFRSGGASLRCHWGCRLVTDQRWRHIAHNAVRTPALSSGFTPDAVAERPPIAPAPARNFALMPLNVLEYTSRRGIHVLVALACMALAACSHNKSSDPDAEPDVRPDPIPIHVKNENFLDVNVAVFAGGMSRRLGMVPGNSSADFTVDWSVANGSGLSLTAVPIGGSGGFNTGALNVAPGQMIEFRIGSLLRQSTAVVHDP
jgi:hypothetical protein